MARKKNEPAVISPETFTLPAYNEIPDVGLYLEQTTKFVSDYLEPLPGINITGSMISNYVKKGIIANPVKKQYYRDQICEIIFIAIAKSVLSLEDIDTMLRIRERLYEAQFAYEYFCKEFMRILSNVMRQEPIPVIAQENAPKEKILLRNTIITVTHKIYLDTYFYRLAQQENETAIAED